MSHAGVQAADEQVGTVDVRFAAGESYEFAVRGHRMLVDQPPEAGGADEAPTPTELFVASLATCVAFYAGRYLTRHGLDRDGLGVSVTYRMATDRPARVADVQLRLRLPKGFPAARKQALLAVASHCTVHNTLEAPPTVTVDAL
ncbi:OsmC family protein [Micromonospora haikouensis]|uniref:OsmC family protein n=1 Tax=Micromonospora haikouensis TaxID=686309 RepID=UPI0037A65B80